MWRWIRNTLIVFSLLICAMSVFLFVRGFWHVDSATLEVPGYVEFRLLSVEQHLGVRWTRATSNVPPYRQSRWHCSYHSSPFDPHPLAPDWVRQLEYYADNSTDVAGVMWFAGEVDHTQHIAGAIAYEFCEFVIPLIYLIGLTAMPPLWRLFRGRRTSKRYRRKHGLCVDCGYNLRATADACPECGSAATPTPRVT